MRELKSVKRRIESDSPWSEFRKCGRIFLSYDRLAFALDRWCDRDTIRCALTDFVECRCKTQKLSFPRASLIQKRNGLPSVARNLSNSSPPSLKDSYGGHHPPFGTLQTEMAFTEGVAGTAL